MTPDQTILVVEDDADDVYFMKRALVAAGITNPVLVLSNGQHALDYLGGVGKYADRTLYPLPFVAFVDLKMPYVDGFEILAWKKEQPALDSLVMVVLTSSDQVRDTQRAYALGARSYLVKPVQPTELKQFLMSMKSYWRLPEQGGPIRLGQA